MDVILLRGINVGGKHRLPMADLRRLIEVCGGSHPQTYIQSGNAVADGDVNGVDLTDAIEREFGFRPSTLVIEASRFQMIAAACPFDLDAGTATHIMFAYGALDFDLRGARTIATTTERIEATDAAVYLSLPDGVARSKLATKLDSFSNVELTGRNGNTINKLLEMLDAHDE